jgi:glycosyltransferase involved in cell wall biosynthesis
VSIHVTFAIPCYNVEPYLDHCIESILEGCAGRLQDIEIILVDDGSAKDGTAARVDHWQRKHPGLIKAIHQANGGHGEAVNTGLANASGLYFKVVDADDWLDTEAARAVMAAISDIVSASSGGLVDLILTNYVYEKVFEGKRSPIRYRGVLPERKVISWDAVGAFKAHQNILMHAAIYRTAVLRECRLKLPSHTFYVDNIFVYVPLPSVQTLYYIDVDLYRYFIGREGQSVNEKTMASRIDQQLRITKIMIDAFVLDRDVADPALRAYMTNYLAMMMTICTVFLLLSGRDDTAALRADIWGHLDERDAGAAQRIRRSLLGRACNLPGRMGSAMTIAGYRLARKIYKFN